MKRSDIKVGTIYRREPTKDYKGNQFFKITAVRDDHSDVSEWIPSTQSWEDRAELRLKHKYMMEDRRIKLSPLEVIVMFAEDYDEEI